MTSVIGIFLGSGLERGFGEGVGQGYGQGKGKEIACDSDRSWNYDDSRGMKIYALSPLSRSFKRLFRRAARFLWCRPLETARSIFETAALYAVVASSLLLSLISFNNFLIDERSVERWPILVCRRLIFCRARFLAWGVLANGSPQLFKKGLNAVLRTRNIVNFASKVKSSMTIFGWKLTV